MRVFLNYKQNVQPDHGLAQHLDAHLRSCGHHVFRDESDLKAGDEWRSRLEKEVRECDCMVSLVSNVSLKSPWVLNEIDLAIRLTKRMVPVLLEEINDSLQFQAFNPRFMFTQWLRATGDHDADGQAIAAALTEPRHQCYRDLIHEKLSKHNVLRGDEVLEALCGVLYQSHWPAVVFQLPPVFDEVPGLRRGPSRSLVEALRDHIDLGISICRHNAANYHNNLDEERSKKLSWQMQRLMCVSEILQVLIDKWNRNAGNTSTHLDANHPHFDNSDGEPAFASEHAITIGEPGPAPKGQVVILHVPREFAQQAGGSTPELKDAGEESAASHRAVMAILTDSRPYQPKQAASVGDPG